MDLLLTTPPQDNLVELSDGTPFPATITTTVYLKGTGPLIELSLEVQEGRPVLTRFSASRQGPGHHISPSDIHDLPLGEIVASAITSIAAMALVPADDVLSAREVIGDRKAGDRAAAIARGRRPVTEEELREVARVARANPYDPRKQVAQQLLMSERTASRLIAKARSLGLIEEKESHNGE